MKRFVVLGLAALLVAAPALAGCLEQVRAAFGLAGGELSAMEVKSRADTVAGKWDKDAFLVAAMTFEASPELAALAHERGNESGNVSERNLALAAAPTWARPLALANPSKSEKTNASGDGDMGEQDLIVADPTPVDGRGPAWLFAYLSGDGSKGLAFVIGANGTVVHRNEQDVRSAKERTEDVITDWKVDSTAAIATARGNATFAKAADAPNASAMLVLGEEKHFPHWIAMVFADKTSPVTAIVNATSGALEHVSSHDMNYNWSMPDLSGCCGGYGGWGGYDLQNYGTVTYSKTYDGQLTTATAPTAEHPFVVESNGEVAHLRLTYQRLAQIEHVTLHAIGNGGRELPCSMKNNGGGFGSGQTSETYTCPGAESGDGLVRLDLDRPGVQANYELRIIVSTR